MNQCGYHTELVAQKYDPWNCFLATYYAMTECYLIWCIPLVQPGNDVLLTFKGYNNVSLVAKDDHEMLYP